MTRNILFSSSQRRWVYVVCGGRVSASPRRINDPHVAGGSSAPFDLPVRQLRRTVPATVADRRSTTRVLAPTAPLGHTQRISSASASSPTVRQLSDVLAFLSFFSLQNSFFQKGLTCNLPCSSSVVINGLLLLRSVLPSCSSFCSSHIVQQASFRAPTPRTRGAEH